VGGDAGTGKGIKDKCVIFNLKIKGLELPKKLKWACQLQG